MKAILWGLVQALVTVFLCGMAVGITIQLQRWEAPGNGYLDSLALLLLLGIAALASATAVLAYPAYLILQRRLREGFGLLLSTIAWLVLLLGAMLTAIVFFDNHGIF